MTLPNFFVIGAPKAGTTSLYDYFREHPDIYMPPVKGPRYFCYVGQQGRTKSRYQTLEEYQALFDDVTTERAIGEATAIYFEHPETAGRIHGTVPEARIIAILREPVQRAFSIYLMNLRSRGANEGLGFLQALERDQALRKLYFDGLEPFFRYFPRDRIKIVLLDDLERDPRGTLRDLFGFLEVDPDFLPDLAVSNPGGIPRSKRLHRLLTNRRVRRLARQYLPEHWVRSAKDIRSRNLQKHAMTDQEWEQAYRYFHDDLVRTQDLIGIDLGAWIRPEPQAEARQAHRGLALAASGPHP